MYGLGASGGVGGVGGVAVAGGAAGAGAGADGAGGAVASAAEAALPFTGFGLIEVAIAGFVLLAAGQAMARMLPRLHKTNSDAARPVVGQALHTTG